MKNGNYYMRKYLNLLSLILITQCFAVNVPDRPNSRVMDLAHLLTPNQQQQLNTKLRFIHDNEKGTEIQILTLPDLGGQPIEDVALDVGRKWKLGQKGRNNGVLILIAAKEHKDRIEVGYGVEGVLPDGYVGNLRRDVLEPNLKVGNYYVGLNATIDKLNQQIKLENNGKLHNQDRSQLNLFESLIGGMVFIIICVLIMYISRRRVYSNLSDVSDPNYSAGTGSSIMNAVVTGAILGGLSNLADGNSSNRDFGSSSGGGFDDSIGGGGDFGGGGSSGDY